MLRSIFSLLHQFLNFDGEETKKKNNRTIVYCSNNPDFSVKMDLEINGKKQTLKSVRSLEELGQPAAKTFQITSEAGDVITCKHYSEIDVVSKSEQSVKKESSEGTETLKTTEDSEVHEFLNETTVSEKSEPRSEGESLKFSNVIQPSQELIDLFAKCPQKPVAGDTTSGRDDLGSMVHQIKKMRSGMEKLKEIAHNFNCLDRYKQDVDFLAKHFGSKGPKVTKNQH